MAASENFRLGKSHALCCSFRSSALTANAAPAAEPAVVIPAPTIDAAPASAGKQTVVLAGGCFWGVQAVFQHTKGVTSAVSGYAGGDKATAHYEMVGSGAHRPRRVGRGDLRPAADFLRQDFADLLLGRAQSDRAQLPGSRPRARQYRSAIFYANDEQKRIAETYIAELDKAHAFPGADRDQARAAARASIRPKTITRTFAVVHPSYPYIVFNDLPKVENLKRLFADRLSRHAGHRDGVEQAGRIISERPGRVFRSAALRSRRTFPAA